MRKAEESEILPSSEESHNTTLQVQTLEDFTAARPTRQFALLYVGSTLVPTTVRPPWTSELHDITLSSAEQKTVEE